MVNNFTNPYGAVLEYARDQRDLEDNGITQVIGKHGKVRHSGKFSSNNPYLAQLQVATENQDKDALYELAVQWEADYANRQMQLEENRAILEEQREYDSPLAQVQRQREAGINPDLASGGSSGASSGSQAQLTNPGMADQQGQTKFSNAYDNTSLVFEGINAAANSVSSFAGAFSSIISGIDLIKTLPSRTRLNESQAGLMDAQATEVNALLNGKKKSLDLSNVAKGIQNSTATLQQLAQFAELISPDTADFAPHLQALGVEEANIAPYTDIIKQMHNNPEMRAKYATNTLAAKWSEAENAQYTEELIGRFVSSELKIKAHEQAFQEDYAMVQAKIQHIIAADPNYARNTADLQIIDADFSRDKQNQLIAEFTRDVEVYAQNIGELAESIMRDQRIIEDIRQKARQYKRPLTPVETAMIEDLENNCRRKRVLGSRQLNAMYDLEKHASRLKFFVNDRFDYTIGETEPLRSLQRHNIESRIIFDDMLTDVATSREIAWDITGKILNAAGVAGAAYIGGRSVAKGRVDKTVREQVSYGTDENGQMYRDTRTWELKE